MEIGNVSMMSATLTDGHPSERRLLATLYGSGISLSPKENASSKESVGPF